jgi:PleD family two-component response regulator
MRILVVEDEAKIAKALKEGLEVEHYQVVVAATGEDGLYRLSSETFDLVVLDQFPETEAHEAKANKEPSYRTLFLPGDSHGTSIPEPVTGRGARARVPHHASDA